MKSQRTVHGWVLRLDRGEEIVSTLAIWAQANAVLGGAISGIGSVGEAELGFFRRETSAYERRTFTGEHEILSLTGNLSLLEGTPFPHCHLILAGPDFVAHGGHLFRGVVTVTCEVHVMTSGKPIVRESRPDLGFHPLAPADD
jgi:predicted DNA-binding protein with PD1-like motif